MRTISEMKIELAQVVADLEKVLSANEVDTDERDFLFSMQDNILSSIKAAHKAKGMKASATRKQREFDAGFECAKNGGSHFGKHSKEWMNGFEAFFEKVTA
jgi:hypothetical protein